jgi:hypothetical protein
MAYVNNDSVGIKHVPGSSIGLGAFAHLLVVLQFAQGVNLFPWSIGGRSVYGWLNNSLLSPSHMTDVLPLYNSQNDGEVVFFGLILGVIVV